MIQESDWSTASTREIQEGERSLEYELRHYAINPVANQRIRDAIDELIAAAYNAGMQDRYSTRR